LLLGIAWNDRESALGQEYLAHQAESVFYREATFFSAAEVGRLLVAGGWSIRSWGQTLVTPLATLRDIEPVRPGTGAGAFAVVQAGNAK
jgi:hypothetical protein